MDNEITTTEMDDSKGLFPGLPAALKDFDDIWTLVFRQGMNPRPQYKHYRFKGNLREAIERFRLFCEQTGRTFVVVTPFLSSIDDEIHKHMNAS